MTTGPAPMERVERTNMVMATPQQRTRGVQQNPYTMDVDKNNRNCYACGGFGHMARHCRNRRMETENNIIQKQIRKSLFKSK